MGLLAKRKEDTEKENAGDLLKREVPAEDFLSKLIKMKTKDQNIEVPTTEKSI